MKKNLLCFVFLFTTLSLFSQWVHIDNGLNGYPPTSLYPMEAAVLLGTSGGGIFLTDDNGANWTDISGNIGNMFINTVNGVMDPGSGNYLIFAGTEDGAYYSGNDHNYTDCSTGLTNRDVNLFWSNGYIGTNGGGFFVSDQGGGYQGPWVAYNEGIDSGDGLIINSIAGYSDDNEDYMVLATDNGVYWGNEQNYIWEENSGNLTGDALKIKGITALSTFILIATENGAYYTLDAGDNWTTLIPDVRFNFLTGGMVAGSPTGMFFLLGGETSYITFDFQTWSELDLGGINGEITAACMTSTELFIGVTNTSKDGGLYRIPIADIENVLVGTDDVSDLKNSNILLQNYPNPALTNTSVSYEIKQSAYVEIVLTDILGREIKSFVSNHQEAGAHSIQISTEDLDGQIYFYSLCINGVKISTKKMSIVR
jgi:hypothetical protein